MCSYSAVNGIPNAVDRSGLEGLLRDQIGFQGFVISDYDEIGRVAGYTLPMSYFRMESKLVAVSQIVTAGVDMLMLPAYAKDEIATVVSNLKAALARNMFAEDRIDQAVSRILTVKLAMGLVKNKTAGRITE